MKNNTIKAIDFMTSLHQHGLITDKEFSKLQKCDPPARDEFKCIVYTPDRDFTLIYDLDSCNTLIMDLYTADGIKFHRTYDERNLRINFDLFDNANVFEYEKLLENFYVKI